MNIIFREATEAEYPIIMQFHKSEDWGMDTPRALRNFQEQGNLIVIAEIEENGNRKVIGKMDLMQKKREGKEFLYVERLIIKEEYRNKGVGKKFLAFAEEECKKRKLKFLDVAVRDENEVAKKLYHGHGFDVIGKKVYMRKEIS